MRVREVEQRRQRVQRVVRVDEVLADPAGSDALIGRAQFRDGGEPVQVDVDAVAGADIGRDLARHRAHEREHARRSPTRQRREDPHGQLRVGGPDCRADLLGQHLVDAPAVMFEQEPADVRDPGGPLARQGVILVEVRNGGIRLGTLEPPLHPGVGVERDVPELVRDVPAIDIG